MKRKIYDDDWRSVGMDYSDIHLRHKEIGNGSWVLVKTNIPVAANVRPEVYGIYWAIPAEDKYNRQKVTIYTPHEVCLLNYEYTPISEDRLREYIEDGYYLRDFGISQDEPLNLKLLQKGRELVEEEREIVWALQLDGLTEQQACEEYFYTHHTNLENKGRCYLPTEELRRQIIAVFGENGVAG